MLAQWRDLDQTVVYDEVVDRRSQIPINTRVPDARIPVVFLLDTSGSMQGSRIAKVNDMMRRIVRALEADALARVKVEIAVVTFSTHSEVTHDFALPGQYYHPELQANGRTAMGEALDKSLDLIEARKLSYRQNGVDYHRPWLIMLTDGLATDDVSAVLGRIKDYQQRKKIVFLPFAIDVSEAEFRHLLEVSERTLLIDETKIDQLGAYLVQNLRSCSASAPSDAVQLSDPTPLINQKMFQWQNP